MDKELVLGGKVFKSRLFVGSGKYSTNTIIPDVMKESKSEMITVAVRG